MSAEQHGDSMASILFTNHFEARQMGDHVREVRFVEPIILHKVQVLNRGEKAAYDSSFEGRTFPNVRTMSLSAFAGDKLASNSTLPRLAPSGQPGEFVPNGRLVTDHVVIRGEYLSLSVAIYGHVPAAGEVPTNPDDDFTGLSLHLRPAAPHDVSMLDLGDFKSQDDIGLVNAIYEDDYAAEAGLVSDADAPTSLSQALALSANLEADARVTEHTAWVASTLQNPDLLEADTAIPRLEALASDLGAVAKHSSEISATGRGSAALVHNLLDLVAKCRERLELRTLRAALRALSVSLCSAATAAEVLRLGGHTQLLNILRDTENIQSSIKLAALEVWLGLSSHAIGMEAFLGWSAGASSFVAAGGGAVLSDPHLGAAAPLPMGTGYEVTMSILLDGGQGHPRLCEIALTLLERAAFYTALVRLDAYSTRLGNWNDSDEQLEETAQSIVDSLSDLSHSLEDLSRRDRSRSGEEALTSLLDSDYAANFPGDQVVDRLVMGMGGEPTFSSEPWLHGFLEAYLSGRRVAHTLCTIVHILPKFHEADRLSIFAGIRSLVCGLLSCVDGVQHLASDMHSLKALMSHLESCAGTSSSSSLQRSVPALPQFIGPWARSLISAPQLAGLVGLHIRTHRLVFLLIAETRRKGRDGLLREADGLSWLRGLHQVLSSGSAGADSVVCAFRHEVLTEWLLRQLEGRVAEAVTGMSQTGGAQPLASLPQPAVRHLVALVHAVTLKDSPAGVAERYGGRILMMAQKALEVLESGHGGGDGSTRTLEFALASDGPDGSLGRAVRGGRRNADVACLNQLRELVAQLAPWQSDDAPIQGQVHVAKLLTSIALSKGPRAFKRSANEERGSRLSLLLGGYCGHGSGVEVAEIDFAAGEAGEAGELPDEKLPPGDAAELPLLAMRVLCRRAKASAKDALTLASAAGVPGGGEGPAKRDIISLLVPVLVRCAAALKLNLEAQAVQEEKQTIDSICATQQVHLRLLEATLETCYHLLKGFWASGVTQFRHTELLHGIFLVADKLTTNLIAVAPGSAGAADPEFRLLLRHSLAWTCQILRAWVQGFPGAAGGQVLQPLLRHCRVLPGHFTSGMLLLAMVGDLSPLLPGVPHHFCISTKLEASEQQSPEAGMVSLPVLFPSGRKSNSVGTLSVKMASEADAAATKDKPRQWGQLWATDADAQDWDGPEVAGGAVAAAGKRDPLVRALSRKGHNAMVAGAFGLVEQVSMRRERLSINDMAEMCSLALQATLTSDALLHCITVRVLQQLTLLGIPLIAMVVRLGEACLRDAGGHGVLDSEQLVADISSAFDSVGTRISGNLSSTSAGNPCDGRALSRVLSMLSHLGHAGPSGRWLLSENGAETLCLSVLAQNSDALPTAAAGQAIEILSQMFAASPTTSALEGDVRMPPPPSVSRCRMVAKALSVLLNRLPQDGHAVGPAPIARALQLLQSLSSKRRMCLNLLFSSQQDPSVGTAGDGQPISVTVSCAFRLTHCAQRLAAELGVADERWEATPRQSEEETEAEEVLAAWLHVGELLLRLCQTVLVSCPTTSVFLAVLLPGAALTDKVDEATLRGVLSDVHSALSKVTGRRRNESIPLRAAALVGNLRALEQQLLEHESGPAPTELTAEDLDINRDRDDNSAATAKPEQPAAKADASGGSQLAKEGDATKPRMSRKDDADVLVDLVSIFSDAAALEETAEWHASAVLDTAEPPGEGATLEFDVQTNRRKRKAAREKADLERKAKRQKQVVQAAVMERPAAAPADAARRRPPDVIAEPAKVAKKANNGPSQAAAPAPMQAAPAAADHPAKGSTQTPAAPAKAAPKGADKQAEAMASFVKDHPEFMRVLTNPKKLSDPRVKSMFVKELQNYPGLKEFLISKGVNLS